MNELNKFDSSWKEAIGTVYLLRLLAPVALFLGEERKNHKVYPELGSDLAFKAFEAVPLGEVKVVVLGQDIYHDGSFNGFAFGNDKSKLSPSLKNIIKEVERTHGGKVNPSLKGWARQGVLLINTAHSVRAGEPESHLELWKDFTNVIMNAISLEDNIVWMLWGKKAQEYEDMITNPTHKVIKTGHPSPLNRTNPFVGSDCFDECDKLVMEMGYPKIKWTEDD